MHVTLSEAKADFEENWRTCPECGSDRMDFMPVPSEKTHSAKGAFQSTKQLFNAICLDCVAQGRFGNKKAWNVQH